MTSEAGSQRVQALAALSAMTTDVGSSQCGSPGLSLTLIPDDLLLVLFLLQKFCCVLQLLFLFKQLSV